MDGVRVIVNPNDFRESSDPEDSRPILRQMRQTTPLSDELHERHADQTIPKIVAEIGCNHRGDLDVAKKMISTAALFCEADVVKFQKRSVRELLTPEQYDAPHPNQMHAYGDCYGRHRDFLEFDVAQHRELIDHCVKLDIQYSTSVWDLTSAGEIAALNPDFIKVPSACNQHFELLKFLCDHFGGDIHVSTGMSTPSEIDALVETVDRRGCAGRLVLYACTSGYPVPIEETCLLEIPSLEETYGSTVQSIGFSGHHLGISIDVAAVVLGARWIERHFTLDRTWKGTDHAASLEPDGLRRLTRDCKQIVKAIRFKPATMMRTEMEQRLKLKRGQLSDVSH